MLRNDIESELSYAYLHAVAAKAGISCKVSGRLEDNLGMDAQLTYKGPTDVPSITSVHLNIQLKATTAETGNFPDHLAYSFKGIKQYDWLRTRDGLVDKFLVVLFLPSNAKDWLSCTAEELVLKKAAYWVCLFGAAESSNATSQTLYIPKANLLTPDSLISLVNFSALNAMPQYQIP